jgi:hypothetical protein
MKKNNRSERPKNSSLKKVIIYVTLIISVVVIFIMTSPTNKNKGSTGFSSALYTGDAKTRGKNHQPSKLKWFDSFKGVNNMGK